MLARSLNRAGHHARAIEILDRGMKLDPLWGEGVEEIMRARAENGESAGRSASTASTNAAFVKRWMFRPI